MGVVCDGTAVNTGRVSGVIKRIEMFLEMPVQWIICLLHLNKLPLRHLFDDIDGKSSGQVQPQEKLKAKSNRI